MSNIRKELETATGLTKGTDTKAVYFVKLAAAAAKLPDEQWDGLSDAAGDWVTKAAEEISAAKKENREPKLTFASDEDDAPAPKTEEANEAPAEDAAEDDEEDADEAPAPKKEKPTKVKKDKTPKAKPEKPAKAPKEPKAKKPRSGFSQTIRKLCLQHQDWKEAKVYEAALKKHPDLPKNTLRSIYQSTMGTIRAANALGYTVEKKAD